jgi:hypothetical protein
MTINRGISFMHLLLKLWNGVVVQHDIDNMILTWNIILTNKSTPKLTCRENGSFVPCN